MVYVPAISDIAHRTLATASDSAKTQCRPILPDSETEDVFRSPQGRCGCCCNDSSGEQHTAQGPARAAGALVKARTGPTLFCLSAETSSHSGLVSVRTALLWSVVAMPRCE